MRILLTLIALFIGSARLIAQDPPPPSDQPPPNPELTPNEPPADDLVAPITGVVCVIVILFAVCYPMRRDD